MNRIDYYKDLSVLINSYIIIINDRIIRQDRDEAWWYYRFITNYLQHEYFRTDRLSFNAYEHFINRINNSINIDYFNCR